MKMKINYVLVALFFVVAMISCGPTSENAKKYDDELVDQLAKVYSKEAALIDAISKKTPEKLDFLFTDLSKQVDSSLASVKKMDNFDGKSDMKDAAVLVFNAYQDAIATDYKNIIILAKISDTLYTPADDDKKIELSKKIDAKINKANDKFLELEKGFISKYKIEIEAKETEKK